MSRKIAYLECQNFNIIYDYIEIVHVTYDVNRKLLNLDQYGFDIGKPFYLKSKSKNYSLNNYRWSFRVFSGFSEESKIYSDFDLELPLRVLGLFQFSEIIKAFCLINYCRPVFSWKYLKEPEFRSRLPRQSDLIEGNILFSFIEGDIEFTFEEYINDKFKTLSSQEYNQIILEVLEDIGNREYMKQELEREGREWKKNQPSLRDAFDDFDQFSSWEHGR